VKANEDADDNTSPPPAPPAPKPPVHVPAITTLDRVFVVARGLLVSAGVALLLVFAWFVIAPHPPKDVQSKTEIKRHLGIKAAMPWVTIRSVKSKSGTIYLKDTPTPTSLDLPPGDYEVDWYRDGEKDRFQQITVSPDREPGDLTLQE